MFTNNSNLKFSEFKVIVFFTLFALAGIFISPLLNVKLNPESSNSNIYISYYSPGASPYNIENNITSKLEGIAASLSGVAEITSESKTGRGQITLKLDKYTNVEKFKLKLSLAIRQAWKHFPEGVNFPEIGVVAHKGRSNKAIMVYRVEGNKGANEINKIVTNSLIPDMLSINGLKEVLLEGVYSKEIHFLIDSDKAAKLKLSNQDILQAIRNYSNITEISGVKISDQTNTGLYTVRFSSSHDRSINANKIPVKTLNDHIVTLSDVISVKQQNSKINSRYRVNGINNIYIRLLAEEKQNHIKVASQIKNEMQALSSSLPNGLNIHLVTDSTTYVKREIRNISYRTLLTVILLIASVWLIYRDRNYIFLIGISLLVNISICFLAYYLLGMEIHFYTMSGITISLGMIIDNSIIVIDYLKKSSEKKIILPLFTATLTTVGALYTINIVPTQIESFWYDFALVIIINLSISFFSALFFIPALIQKFPFNAAKSKNHLKLSRVARFNYLYSKYIDLAVKHKRLIIIVYILAFGTPFFRLPSHLNENIRYCEYYNKIFSNPFFSEKIRPFIDKATGGFLRPFVENAIGNYKTSIHREKKLTISGNSQKEYSFKNLNTQVEGLESFLLGIKGIKNIEVEVTQNKKAYVGISFEERSDPILPLLVLDECAGYLNKYAGGTDWMLSFEELNTQVTHEVSKSNKLWGFYLYGYNFEELTKIAKESKARLQSNPRVRNVSIHSKHSFFNIRESQSQSVFHFNDSLNINHPLIKKEIVNSIAKKTGAPLYIGSFKPDTVLTKHYLSANKKDNDPYRFMNEAGFFGEKYTRLIKHGHIRKEISPVDIVRYNQQYQLFLSFDFMGSASIAKQYEKEQIRLINSICPSGFSAGNKFKKPAKESKAWLFVISLIILTIFFITSILFESLKQALWVIMIIPFSYIGVFLVFHIFNVNFDQGGYASFVLLGGITVNAIIYFTNAFNNLQYCKNEKRRYLKAWNKMITPILITVLSTIVGFIPFLLGGSDVLWKALATGTIGGLVFSIFTIAVVLPVVLVKR